MKQETKEKLKLIGRVTLWSALVTGLFISLGFAEKQEGSLPCKSLDINISQETENFFVQNDDVKQMITDRGDSIINQPVSTIDIPELEHVLNSNASIAKAEVYMTVDGKMKIDVVQRRPVIRIMNKDGDSYYIDDKGELMPLSDKYTARVLIANGNLFEPFSKRYMYSIRDIENNPHVKDITLMDDLFRLALYIGADEFWKAQVQQLYVNDDKEIELVPRVGDHKIVFGDASDMDEKFKKLMTFYQEGLNTTGWWNNYSSINLKFKNQIVCTKKS